MFHHWLTFCSPSLRSFTLQAGGMCEFAPAREECCPTSCFPGGVVLSSLLPLASAALQGAQAVHKLHSGHFSEPIVQIGVSVKNAPHKKLLHMRQPDLTHQNRLSNRAERHLLTATTASAIPPPPRDCSPKIR